MLVAFVIVIAEDDDDRNAQANEYIQQRLHLGRLAIVGQVAGHDQQVGLVAHRRQLLLQGVGSCGREMQVSCCSNSHMSYDAFSSGAEHTTLFERSLPVRRARYSVRMSSSRHSRMSIAN